MQGAAALGSVVEFDRISWKLLVNDFLHVSLTDAVNDGDESDLLCSNE